MLTQYERHKYTIDPEKLVKHRGIHKHKNIDIMSVSIVLLFVCILRLTRLINLQMINTLGIILRCHPDLLYQQLPVWGNVKYFQICLKMFDEEKFFWAGATSIKHLQHTIINTLSFMGCLMCLMDFELYMSVFKTSLPCLWKTKEYQTNTKCML